MLNVMPQWWDELMLWMDTSFIPVWVIVLAFVLVQGYRLCRDIRAYHRYSPPDPNKNGNGPPH